MDREILGIGITREIYMDLFGFLVGVAVFLPMFFMVWDVDGEES